MDRLSGGLRDPTTQQQIALRPGNNPLTGVLQGAIVGPEKKFSNIPVKRRLGRLFSLLQTACPQQKIAVVRARPGGLLLTCLSTCTNSELTYVNGDLMGLHLTPPAILCQWLPFKVGLLCISK
jgi:hypothetical protein